jgi:hypothetical protein
LALIETPEAMEASRLGAGRGWLSATGTDQALKDEHTFAPELTM